MSIKYKDIASTLRQQILSARSLVSYKLPTEMDLCKTYGVSRQTIRQALDVLTQEGLIYKKQGSGIYTIPHASHLDEKVVFLISEENEYTYPAFLSSIQNLLLKEGITPLIQITGHDYNTERKILSALLKKPPVILVIEGVKDTFENPNLDLYEKLLAENVSFIFMNSDYPTLPRTLHISSADYEGGYLLGEHLITAGLYQVSAILPDFAANAKSRYQGLLAAYRDHSLPIPQKEIFWYNWNDLKHLRIEQNSRFLHSFVHTQQKGEAVFCYNDEIAYQLIKEFARAQISVPSDVSVVSFDNSYLSRISTPPITSLALADHALENELVQQIKFLLEYYSMNDTSYRYTSIGTNKKTLPWKLISRSSVSIL